MARLLSLFLLTISINSSGQDLMPSDNHPPFLVKWNPLNLFDTESMFQISAERFLAVHSSIQAEIGYGPPFLDKLSLFKNGKLDDRQAWRFRTEYRWYRQSGTMMGKYWAVEGFGLTVNGTQTATISDIYGGTNTPKPFPIHKRVIGFHLKAGIQRPIGRKNKSLTHWLYDVYGGLGLRHSQTSAESVDGITYIHSIGGQFFDVYRPTSSGIRLSPSVVIGVKLAYRVW